MEVEIFDEITEILCGKVSGITAEDCFKGQLYKNLNCINHGCCRIWEKTDDQINFVIHSINYSSYLRACAGSGKTEVVGIKAAYEIKQWPSNFSGIAVLTFTNNAANVIRERVKQFSGTEGVSFPHFIGTFDSWLHGYLAHPFAHLVTKYKGQNNDFSIQIIDDQCKTGFLNNYKTEKKILREYVFANQYYFDKQKENFTFSSGKKELDLIRKQILDEKKDNLLEDLKSTKKKFWKAGFATYQDIEYFCYLLLTQEVYKEIKIRIAQRFPIIIIDECQDLSWIQLEILQVLIKNGIKVHFIGDLNQAIFSFRDGNPESVRSFINENNFKQINLNNNFRSVQPIVDLCGKLVDQGIIRGRQDQTTIPPCLYYVYEKDKINELPGKFIDFITQNKFDVSKSAILARNYSTISKLRPGSIHQGMEEEPAIAIHVWNNSGLCSEIMEDALLSMGKFISYKFFPQHSSNSQNLFCPKTVESNVTWRLFLARLLDKCCLDRNILNMEVSWSEWAAIFRKSFISILLDCTREFEDVKVSDLNNFKYRAPNTKADHQVLKTFMHFDDQSFHKIRITTFHKIKGETLDTVMVVSSQTNAGRGGGYWENWLENHNENARFAYVASSRPRNLLIWAIPATRKNEDFLRLKQLGFIPLNDDQPNDQLI